MKCLQESIDRILLADRKPVKDAEGQVNICCSDVTEDITMKRYGASLQLVANLRDSYVTTACDVCEQLWQDVRTLKSYEGRKGFDSSKMCDVIDILDQNKTRYEDVDEFLNTTQICTYCADKLRGNKEVAKFF